MFDSNRNGFPLTLNLQLFAEGDNGGGGGGNPPASELAGVTSNQQPDSQPQQPQKVPLWGLPENPVDGQAAPAVNPLLADPNPPAAPQEIPEAPPAPGPMKEVFDFAGRKIEVSDPAVIEAIRAVHGDYLNLERTFTQTSMRAKELETQNQTFQQLLQSLQQQSPQPQQPVQQEPQKTPEEMAQEFMDKFYENPQGALEGLFQQFFEKTFEQKLKPVIEPVQKIAEERQMVENINQLRQKYPNDFDQVAPVMQEVLNENPNLLAQGLETVYYVAKGRMVQTQAPPPTPEQLLADPNFVQHYVLENQEIVQKVVNRYLQNKQQQQQQTPTVMGGQPGGQPPTIPENRPTTLREASKAWLRSMGVG